MIRAGDAITNPVTGEHLLFHRTASDTDGEYVLLEATVEPDGFVASAHVHPSQSERFEVLDGALGVRVGRTVRIVHAGETLTVPPGTPHRFWNAGGEQVRFLCEVRPALAFERLLETMFALARDGKTNRKGMPNPLRLAVIADAHFEVVRLPIVPAALQRVGLLAGAGLGRALGYRPVYGPTTEALPVVRRADPALAAI
jgi:mannose-6-phosphate isomerase-like protein (cupin superfamily)